MSENTFSLIHYSVSVHLAFDTIYYVESKENVALNKAMLEIEQAGQVLFADTELQPFPFKLKCISQDELSPENLFAKLNDAYEADRVEEAIESLRDCLAADKGGVLSVRCLPGQKDNENGDRCDIFTAENFGDTSPEDALATLKSFARHAALENFQRLAGIPYVRFKQAKEEELHPRRHSNNSMGFIVVPTDPKEIIREMRLRLDELDGTINEQTEYYDIVDALENDLESLKNKVKYNKPCKLRVDWESIQVEIDGKWEKVKFGRCDQALALYVFFLRQIMRAKRDSNISPYLSQEEMRQYSKELTKLYKNFSGKEKVDISTWFLKSTHSGDFANAKSTINKFFKNELDVETLKKKYSKCYSIANMGKDSYGNPRYGIGLDPDDFDLGIFSIDEDWI